MLAEQLVPPVQMRPHTPQLLLSVTGLRQLPEQLTGGAAQCSEPAPAEQTWPAGQTFPQVPQLELSVWSARHVPVQAV